MKKVIIVILMLAFGMSIQAQNNGFISLFGGLTMPSGNWTNTAYNANEVGSWNPSDAANLSSGFAGNGSTFGIEGAYFFSKYFGVGGMVSYSTFGFKGGDSLSADYQASFDVDQVTTSVGAGYTMWNFMYGLYFRYPFTEKFSATAKLLGGMTSVTTPSIAVDVEDGGIDDGVFTQNPCTANSFGYMVGIGVSYKIFDYLSINFQGNYSSSQPDFLIDNTNFNTNVGRELKEYNQPLTYMNVTLGVSYLFGGKKE